MQRARQVIWGLLVLGMAWAAAGCTPLRGPAVPLVDTKKATIPGIPEARFWIDDTDAIVKFSVSAVERERAYLEKTGRNPNRLPPAHFLAVSGGGEDGAFGAGLLVGWTQAGTRPEFKMVTGVSTGALTAPFAFLGPDYDQQLKAVYTELTAADIFSDRWFTAAVFDDAMRDTAPLRATVKRFADQRMLERIAEEYQKGRILLIGTTNLDVRRSVIWNIGAIAASRAPNALDLFHDILLASAAVPGAFPPVLIDVDLNGQPYQELHVDGGAISQVFVYPPSLDQEIMRSHGVVRERHLYVIRNSKLTADWAATKRQTLGIVGRAISSLIQSQGVGDIYQIYLSSRRDHIDFNLANIGEDFNVVLNEPFEQEYMRALFNYGFNLGRSGYSWRKMPPGYHELTPAGMAGGARQPVMAAW